MNNMDNTPGFCYTLFGYVMFSVCILCDSKTVVSFILSLSTRTTQEITTLATKMAGIIAHPPFDPDATAGASLAPRWKTWLSDFKTYLVENATTDDTRKRALLLYLAGPRVREIFRYLPDTGDEADFTTALTKLNNYLEPQHNRLYEVYIFRQAFQKPNETIDRYHNRLRGLAESCDFSDADFEILLQIVLHGTSSHLRKHALKNPTIKLSDLLLGTKPSSPPRGGSWGLKIELQTSLCILLWYLMFNKRKDFAK